MFNNKQFALLFPWNKTREEYFQWKSILSILKQRGNFLFRDFKAPLNVILFRNRLWQRKPRNILECFIWTVSKITSSRGRAKVVVKIVFSISLQPRFTNGHRGLLVVPAVQESEVEYAESLLETLAMICVLHPRRFSVKPATKTIAVENVSNFIYAFRTHKRIVVRMTKRITWLEWGRNNDIENFFLAFLLI